MYSRICLDPASLTLGFFFFNENLKPIVKRLGSHLAPQFCPTTHFMLQMQIPKSYENNVFFPKPSDSKI